MQIGPISIGWDSPIGRWGQRHLARGASGLGIDDEIAAVASSKAYRYGTAAFSAFAGASAPGVGTLGKAYAATPLASMAAADAGLIGETAGSLAGFATGGQTPIGGNGFSVGVSWNTWGEDWDRAEQRIGEFRGSVGAAFGLKPAYATPPGGMTGGTGYSSTSQPAADSSSQHDTRAGHVVTADYSSANQYSQVDLAGSRKTANGYRPKGEGQHVVPVELWDKYGFAEEAMWVFDGIDYEDSLIRSADGRHDYLGHGRVTGYTGHVDELLNKELKKFMEGNSVRGKLTVDAQIRFAKDFVSTVRSTDNKYIKGFNSAIKSGGKAGLETWLKETGRALPKPTLPKTRAKILGIAAAGVSRTVKTLKLAKAVPVIKIGAGVALSWLTYSEARAGGLSPAKAIALTAGDVASPVPVGPSDIVKAGTNYGRAFDTARSIGRGELPASALKQFESPVIRNIGRKANEQRRLLEELESL